MAASAPIASRLRRHLGADLLSQHVDGHRLPVAAEMPVGPAVAGRRAFQLRAHLWIEPLTWSAISVPSARTLAICPRELTSISPGRSMPRSTSCPKGTRGSARFDRLTSSADLS
jgi:hypothetical protein